MATAAPGPSAAQPPPARGPSNLALRILSGLVLVAATVLVDWSGLLPFALAVLAVVLAMSWEWGRIVRGVGSGAGRGVDLPFAMQAVSVSAAVLLAGFGHAALGLVAVCIGALILLALDFGRGGLISALGVPYAGLPALALLWLRSDVGFGLQATLYVLVVVWAMDIFALFGGRSIGGPKLWPRVSPNKTWAGLLSGAAASTIAGAAFAKGVGGPVAALAATGLVLGLVSQAGDLAESALKRSYGVKDSSGLIPGHGGFLDRVDGVVAASIGAAIISLVVNAEAPGRALLFGH